MHKKLYFYGLVALAALTTAVAYVRAAGPEVSVPGSSSAAPVVGAPIIDSAPVANAPLSAPIESTLSLSELADRANRHAQTRKLAYLFDPAPPTDLANFRADLTDLASAERTLVSQWPQDGASSRFTPEFVASLDEVRLSQLYNAVKDKDKFSTAVATIRAQMRKLQPVRPPGRNEPVLPTGAGAVVDEIHKTMAGAVPTLTAPIVDPEYGADVCFPATGMRHPQELVYSLIIALGVLREAEELVSSLCKTVVTVLGEGENVDQLCLGSSWPPRFGSRPRTPST